MHTTIHLRHDLKTLFHAGCPVSAMGTGQDLQLKVGSWYQRRGPYRLYINNVVHCGKERTNSCFWLLMLGYEVRLVSIMYRCFKLYTYCDIRGSEWWAPKEEGWAIEWQLSQSEFSTPLCDLRLKMTLKTIITERNGCIVLLYSKFSS